METKSSFWEIKDVTGGSGSVMFIKAISGYDAVLGLVKTQGTTGKRARKLFIQYRTTHAVHDIGTLPPDVIQSHWSALVWLPRCNRGGGA